MSTASPDFVSLVLSLTFYDRSSWRRPLPTWWGRASQQAFLRVIDNRDVVLVKELHPGLTNSERVPYTVSSLIGFDPNKLNFHKSYFLRFTSVHPQVVRILLEEAQTGVLQPGQVLELDGIPFRVQECDWERSDWAYVGIWPQLMAMIDEIDLDNQNKITLEFASPTFFKRHNPSVIEPLPLPELVFDQISRLGDHWAGISPEFKVKDYAAHCMRVDQSAGLRFVEFETRRDMRGWPVMRTGALGKVVYRFLEPDPETVRYFYKLAYFGFFAGVGKETTAGCGQVKVAE